MSKHRRGGYAAIAMLDPARPLSNRAIAERLVVAERTVDAHVKQIFQQLDLAARPDSQRRVLAVLAYLRG